MRTALRAGVALFNAGRSHAAHDAWEDRWLELETGTTDERFLHGLIQYTAAIHHLETDNPEGAAGLATSAQEYLADLPSEYHGVDLAPVRSTLAAIDANVDKIDPDSIPSLTHDDAAVSLTDLDRAERWIVAEILAEESAQFDEAAIGDAIAYAHDADPGGRFATLVTDFVEDAHTRALIHDRLVRHVERERAKRRDVDRLFGEEEPPE